MDLSVIIPVYNEAATLEELIGRVRATGLAYEIIVVDDGSSDDSLAILERLRNETHPPLTILRHQHNRGKGAAMRTGLGAVTGHLVLVQDADLALLDESRVVTLRSPTDAEMQDLLFSWRVSKFVKSNAIVYG